MAAHNPRRILIFDDDFVSMQDLKEHLEEQGWTVELSAEEALLQRLKHERFDLLIVDAMIHPIGLDAKGEEVRNVHFEGVPWLQTGVEFVRRLRAGEFSVPGDNGICAEAPVIMLSAVSRTSLIGQDASPAPVGEYIEKPFRLSELMAKIRKLLKE